MNIFDPKQLALLQIDPEENASLETLLTKNNLTLLELLSIKNIQPKIRSNFTFFIKHCQKNQDFCFNLIDIGIKCPMHDSASDNMKQVCYIAADVLTCDQDVVADLLILPDNSKPKKNDSGNQSDQFEEIQENIETQITDSPEPQSLQAPQNSLTDEEKFIKKYKYLIRILEYIGNQQANSLDQNCINYMIKSLNCVLRKKAEQFLDFLDKKPQILKKLIQLNNYSSISQFLIKILSEDEIQGPKAQATKKIIIEGALEQFMKNIASQDFVDRLQFLDQMFQTNKYASEDDRTELQKLSDIFTSQQTIQFFFQHLKKPASEVVFFNSISYLNCIVKRMNVDEEIDPYSYSNEPKQETMLFKMDILYKEFPSILKEGYNSLNNFQYSELYKKKIVETHFYELLVLLSKNSRFSNCWSGQPKQQDSILHGNNIILADVQSKIQMLKQLIKQFTNQSKNGINRICLISLIEKTLTLQIYQPNNHKNESDKEKQGQKSENHTQPKTEQVEVKKQNSSNDGLQKQESLSKNQEEQVLEGQDKKKKINKIKEGLKLNIKKFSLQVNQTNEKQEQKKQTQTKKPQGLNDIKKKQTCLKKDQVLQILTTFSQMIKGHPELAYVQLKNREKNNQTQVGALINKILMILSNSIDWSSYQEDVAWTEKQNYIKEVESIFSSFNFDLICKNYSITLATTKHPNASAKQKTNPELMFTNEFFKIYLKNQTVQKPKQSKEKNLQLSDSDFKSDQEEIHAVKCTIQEFKKLTGFKFETQISAKTQNEKEEPSQLDNNVSNNSSVQNNKLQEVQKTSQQNQKQKTVIEEKKQDFQQRKKNVQDTQLEQKKVGKIGSQCKSGQQKKLKEQPVNQQKNSLEFYIKHRLILV